MQIQNFADLLKTIQATIEGYFGLSAKVDFTHFYPDKAYKPLCKKLGVGIFGANLMIHSPTDKPVCGLEVTWSFQTGGQNVDTDVEDDDFGLSGINWNPGMMGHSRRDEPLPTLTTDTNVRRVQLNVKHIGKSGWTDLTDLRCLIREKLKSAFPEVTVKLTD